MDADLASRRLPGFTIGSHHDAELAKAALGMAAAERDIAGVIFHSSQGGEYIGGTFANACDALGMVQSMGRVGSALDNAAAESFNSTLKWELPSRRHFATGTQARSEIAGFIDRYRPSAPPQQLRDEAARHLRTDPRRQNPGRSRIKTSLPQPPATPMESAPHVST